MDALRLGFRRDLSLVALIAAAMALLPHSAPARSPMDAATVERLSINREGYRRLAINASRWFMMEDVYEPEE